MTWLETVVRVSPNHRSSHRPFCKSSSARNVRFSLDGPSKKVPSPSSTGSLSRVPREPRASYSSRSLPTTDRAAPGNESSHQRAKHQMYVHHSGIHFPDCSRVVCSPAAMRARDQQQQSLYVGAGQAVGGGHPGARGLGETPRPPAVASSASSAALRDDTSYSYETAAAVTITKRCGVRASRNNQPSTPCTAPRHKPSYFHTCSQPSFLSEPCDHPRPCGMAASQGKRTDDWASPKQVHKYANQHAYTCHESTSGHAAGGNAGMDLFQGVADAHNNQCRSHPDGGSLG